MATEYLDYPGLQYYHGKVKEAFASKAQLELDFAPYAKTEDIERDYVRKSLLESVMDDYGKAALAQPKSQATVAIKDSGSYPAVGLDDFGSLGSFAVNGLLITGTAKKASVPAFNAGGATNGYFVGLHIENCKLIKTANFPQGKAPDETNDWLFLLGEADITLGYIDVVDNTDATDRYLVAITKEGVKHAYATEEQLERHKVEADLKYATKAEVDVETLRKLEEQFKQILGDSSTLEEALDGLFVPKDQAATKDDISDMETKSHASSAYATKEEAATKEELKSYATKADIASAYTPKGRKTAEELTADLLVADNVGDVYDVTTAITTDANFIEGAGQAYPAGTNVVIVEQDGSYKFDALAGMVDLSAYAKTADFSSISNEEIDGLFTD